MKICSIVVTRSKSCHVRTMHTLLQMNLFIIQSGSQHEIVFVNDDPFDKSEMIAAKLLTAERLVFIDYSIHIDNPSIQHLLASFTEMDFHCLVLPCVKEGINWDRFKEKIKENKYGTEPVSQLALDFDTVVDSCVNGDIYKVKSTESRCWSLDCKPVARLLTISKEGKKKVVKKNFTIPPKPKDMFDLFKSKNVKLYTYTAANLVCIYSHECLGNIMNASGIKMT